MKFISHAILLLCCATIALFAKSGQPEIRKEVRKVNGKNVEYMWINGIKVHESDPKKQPQPPVVEPKLYDAKSAKAPKGAKILFDGTEASLPTGRLGTVSQPSGN